VEAFMDLLRVCAAMAPKDEDKGAAPGPAGRAS
jgi:hypothetical protein